MPATPTRPRVASPALPAFLTDPDWPPPLPSEAELLGRYRGRLRPTEQEMPEGLRRTWEPTAERVTDWLK